MPSLTCWVVTGSPLDLDDEPLPGVPESEVERRLGRRRRARLNAPLAEASRQEILELHVPGGRPLQLVEIEPVRRLI